MSEFSPADALSHFEQPTSPKRILCVENKRETCKLIQDALRGYDVIAVRSLDDAREYYRKHKFSLILLDGCLADDDGVAFCEEIRTRDFLTPVIFITDDPNLSEVHIRIAGAQKLLRKQSPEFLLDLKKLTDGLSVRR